MDTAAVLSPTVLMPRLLNVLRAGIAALLLAGTPALQAAPDEADTVSEAPAVERYRELSLALMVAEGASPEWVDALAPGLPSAAPSGALEPPLRIEALQTPLNRIVDQRDTVTEAARLFRFVIERRGEIDAELQRIAAAHPDEVAALDPARLAEDALIARSALSAGIEYSGRDAEPAWVAGLEAYQQETVYLRNMMEYWEFDQELAAITEQALLDTGTRIEAYQRLLEVDPRLDAFTQHLRAVEHIYRSYGAKVKPPDDPSEDLIREASKVD